jgi:hypothetical protein
MMTGYFWKVTDVHQNIEETFLARSHKPSNTKKNSGINTNILVGGIYVKDPTVDLLSSSLSDLRAKGRFSQMIS